MPTLQVVSPSDAVAEIRAAINDHADQLDGAILEGDARLSNPRTPSDGSVTWTKLGGGLVGTTSETLAAGDDFRLSNPRTPTPHASTHLPGGSDYGPIPFVTALPDTPAEGQECYFLTNSRVWHLKYRTASSKWEFAGGPALEAFKAGSGSIPGGAAYVDASDGAGPTVTLPLAGDYRVEYGARWSSGFVWVGLSFGGAAPNTLFRIAQSVNGPSYFSQVFTGLASGSTIKQQYQFDTAVSQILDRFVRITPVRVG